MLEHTTDMLTNPDPQVGDPLAELVTPALLVDPERLDRNVASVQQVMTALGVSLRPHWKTSKCVQVARRQRAAGAIGFTCATSREVATLLAEDDLGEVLWAHLPVGPAKTRFAAQAAASGRLTVGIDSVVGGQALSDAATKQGTEIAYLLEVESGSGRAGLGQDKVVDARRRLDRLPGLRFRGVFTFEGAGLGGLAGHPRQLSDAARASGRILAAAAASLATAGSPCEVVSVGSTPGLHDTASVAGITESRPGTYVYYDLGQVNYGKASVADCALTVLARVISSPRAGQVIIDAGSKAMSSDRSNLGTVMGLACDLELNPLAEVTFSKVNEEHGWLVGPGTCLLAVGDLVRIVPNHACTATNSWSRLLVVEGGLVTDIWPIVARY